MYRRCDRSYQGTAEICPSCIIYCCKHLCWHVFMVHSSWLMIILFFLHGTSWLFFRRETVHRRWINKFHKKFCPCFLEGHKLGQDNQLLDVSKSRHLDVGLTSSCPVHLTVRWPAPYGFLCCNIFCQSVKCCLIVFSWVLLLEYPSFRVISSVI